MFLRDHQMYHTIKWQGLGVSLKTGTWFPMLLASSMHRPVVDHWSSLSPQPYSTGPMEQWGWQSPWAHQPWEPGQSWIQPLTEGTPSAPEKCPWGDSCCYPVPAPWQMGAGRGGLPSLDIALQQWLAPGGGGLHSATGSGTLASHRLNTRVSPAPWGADTNLKSILNLGAEIYEQKEEMDLCKRPGVDGRQRICHRVAKRKVSLCSAWWLT